MTSLEPSTMSSFLRTLEARSVLSTEERQAFLDLPFTPAQVKANYDFVKQGEILRHSCFVLDGVIGSFKQDAEGNARSFRSSSMAKWSISTAW